MSRFYKLLFSVSLLFSGAAAYTQEQQFGRDDYQDTRTIRWSEWSKSQPKATQSGNQSAYESKSPPKSKEGGFLTSEEMNYLLSDEQTEVPRPKKAKPISVKKSVPDDKSKTSVKSIDVRDNQISSLEPTHQLPATTLPEPAGEPILLGIAAASAFLLLQIVIAFLIWKILARFRKIPPAPQDIELDSIRGQLNLELQSFHDEIRALRMRNDEFVHQEQEKISSLLSEIDRLNIVVGSIPATPNSELDALQTQFTIEKKSLQDEMVISQQQCKETIGAEREKNRLLLLEIERLNATLAIMAAEPSSELELLRGQLQQENKLLHDKLNELQVRNDELLRSERAKNSALLEEIERLGIALYEKSTAPSPKNILIDESALDKILTIQSDGFMER